MLSLIDSGSEQSDCEESPKFGKSGSKNPRQRKQTDSIDDIINELDNKNDVVAKKDNDKG